MGHGKPITRGDCGALCYYHTQLLIGPAAHVPPFRNTRLGASHPLFYAFSTCVCRRFGLQIRKIIEHHKRPTSSFRVVGVLSKLCTIVWKHTLTTRGVGTSGGENLPLSVLAQQQTTQIAWENHAFRKILISEKKESI